VILGCKYDQRIDIWSLGCIVAELFTGNVLFQNDTVQGLLARVIGICGPFPDEMFATGRLVDKFFTKDRLLYQSIDIAKANRHLSDDMVEILKQKAKGKKVELLIPKRTTLKARIRSEDTMFVDFIKT
jgi:serine/threonine protein kinase